MNKRWPVIAGFVLFVLLCVSAAYWAMQLFQPPKRPVAAPPRAAAPAIQPQAAASLFGGRTGAATVSNFKLLGVIFAGAPDESVAILSTEGKPARAVRVGAEVVPGVKVKEVHRGYVLLSEGGATKRVDLPEKAEGSATSAALRAPLPQRPPPMTPPPPPPESAAPSQPPASPPAPTGYEGSQAVPDAAAAARGQRTFEQPPPDGSPQQPPAELAPGTQSSIVVNPGGGVSTEAPPGSVAGGG